MHALILTAHSLQAQNYTHTVKSTSCSSGVSSRPSASGPAHMRGNENVTCVCVPHVTTAGPLIHDRHGACKPSLKLLLICRCCFHTPAAACSVNPVLNQHMAGSLYLHKHAEGHFDACRTHSRFAPTRGGHNRTRPLHAHDDMMTRIPFSATTLTVPYKIQLTRAWHNSLSVADTPYQNFAATCQPETAEVMSQPDAAQLTCTVVEDGNGK